MNNSLFQFSSLFLFFFALFEGYLCYQAPKKSALFYRHLVSCGLALLAFFIVTFGTLN